MTNWFSDLIMIIGSIASWGSLYRRGRRQMPKPLGALSVVNFDQSAQQNLSLKCDYPPDYFLLGEMSVFIADLATNGELYTCPVPGGILQNPELPFHEKTCNILHKPIYDP